MLDLPKDPVLLLSVVNTELRDRFPNLRRFCKAHQIDEGKLVDTLKSIDYTYDPDLNQFV